MRTLPDKWNPRLWLRDWLTAQSKSELAQEARTRAGIRAATSAWHAKQDAIDASRREDSAQPAADRTPREQIAATKCGSPDL